MRRGVHPRLRRRSAQGRDGRYRPRCDGRRRAHPRCNPETSMTRRILAILFLSLVAVSAAADVRQLSRAERKERIKNLSDSYRQFLADVEPIMQPEELDTFLQLESDPQRDLYIEDFWQRRAKARGIAVEVLRQQYYDRLQTAKEKFHSVSSDRGRIYVIQGEPQEIREYGGYNGCHLIQKLQVWTYGYLPEVGHNVPLVFYEPRGGPDFRLWVPVVAHPEWAVQDIIASEVVAMVHDDQAAAVRYVFG